MPQATFTREEWELVKKHVEYLQDALATWHLSPRGPHQALALAEETLQNASAISGLVAVCYNRLRDLTPDEGSEANAVRSVFTEGEKPNVQRGEEH